MEVAENLAAVLSTPPFKSRSILIVDFSSNFVFEKHLQVFRKYGIRTIDLRTVYAQFPFSEYHAIDNPAVVGPHIQGPLLSLLVEILLANTQ